MFFEYELKRHNKKITNNFTAEETSKIIDSAIIDLKNRNIPGSVIMPLSYLVGGLATTYASEHSFLFLFLGSILFISTILRMLSIFALSKKTLTRKQLWIPIFFWANMSVGLVWAIFAATATLHYHDTPAMTLIVILLAGIGSGSMASYCIWRLLSSAYLLTILGLPMIAEFYVGTLISITVGIALCFSLIFNLIQAKVWNKHYWLSLINAFVIEKNTLELETLNTQLTTEISDHKLTARDIAISRKKLQDIYNSAHDGIFIFDLDGNVLDVNDTMLKMFNAEKEKAITFTIERSFQSKQNIHVNIKNIWKAAVTGKDQEFTWLTKNPDKDTLSTLQVNLRKTLWGDDSVIIATVRNISQQVEAMEATITANHAKTEFLANMSHELRTPMHGILGYARLGIKRSESMSREKLEEYFQIISESANRLMGLLDNVLDFSKLEIGKMRYDLQKNDLSRMIQEVATELTPIASEKKLHFKIECPCGSAIVYCDIEKIMQVLRNLLFNAIKFSYENNQIDITCEETQDNLEQPGTLVSIFNRGVSIPNDELTAIFEKFIQSSVTNTGAGGTGLGLAISKRFVNGHNGNIWAENDSNGLTIFRFILPRNAKENRRNRSF
jgi:PAS domain S-box-containing protein